MSNQKELPKSYNARDYEDEIYQKWEKSGFFNPDVCVKKGITKKDAPVFSLMMPPPNVTGVLHLGHALENSLMDTMTRYQRMQGKRTLFLPGTDHAAVATQSRVEQNLIESGKYKNPRQELGRETLLKIIREYSEDCKTTILKQIKKLGSSCDWSRLAYTFDEERSKAVNTMFKKMYDDGLIYQGKRIVNWDPRMQTTVADDEVEYIDEKTKFYYLQYGPVVIATARPETKFGDKYLVMHPDDGRYKKYKHRQKIDVEWINGKITATIIKDKAIDMEFGSGVMTITPWHDMTDFEIAERHSLDYEQIIDSKGKLLNIARKFSGMHINKARPKIVEKLEKKGLLVKVEDDYAHSIAVNYRGKGVIEPQIMKQWFVDVNKKIPGKNKSLKNLMREAVTIGHNCDKNPKGMSSPQKVEITPKRFQKNYLHWIDNLRDWCISRQIWWGHRIPVWYMDNKAEKQENKKTNKPVRITYYVHGTTIDNENNKASGQYDVELSKLGIKQSKELKKITKDEKFDVVFCSDLKRAVDSAEMAFGDRFKIIKDKRLRECDYGDMARGDNKKVEAMEKEIINTPFPNGENYKNVEKRIQDFLEDLQEKYAGKKIAIVAHKAPQLALEVLLNGKTWKQAIDKDWRKKKAWQPGWDYIVNNEPQKIKVQEKSPGDGWVQDPDTLDTWFSSGLWTFSTLGWPPCASQACRASGDRPAKSDDLKTYHPTTFMQMGYEILFFWMARMILMSTYGLDEIPFKDVYIHGMLRNEKGKKFSKSDKTGTDPLEMIEQYGTDALRLSLLLGTTPGNDSRFYEEKIRGSRNFVNKLWNVSRFIIMNSDANLRMHTNDTNTSNSSIRHQASGLSDKWILSELNKTIKETTESLEKFQFSRAGEVLYEFTWTKLADWYLEISKVEGNKDKILIHILTNLLKLWHPFVPFVTEQIWSSLSDDMLMVEKWPKFDKDFIDGCAGRNFSKLQEIVIMVRNTRTENKCAAGKTLNCKITSDEHGKLIGKEKLIIEKLARVKVQPPNFHFGSSIKGSYTGFDVEVEGKELSRKI